jgi:hypothetical protein
MSYALIFTFLCTDLPHILLERLEFLAFPLRKAYEDAVVIIHLT